MENLNTETLSHHGVQGQRWGIRRYQYKDGSLTPAGRKRANKLKDEYASLTGKKLVRKNTDKKGKKVEDPNKPKRIRDMSDEEIRQKITRLENEKRLANLQNDTATRGKKFVSTVGKQVVAPAAIESGKRLLTDLFMKVGKKQLGLEPAETKDALADLRKEVEELELTKRKTVAQDYFTKREEKAKTSEKEPEVVKAKPAKKKKTTKAKNVVYEAQYENVPNNTTALAPYEKKRRTYFK